MNFKIISRNLIKLRQDKNWTQEDLSYKLHISRQAISKWESGSSLPNLETLLKLSKLYNISINEILEPKTCIQIRSFEEINSVNTSVIKNVLSKIDELELVKASMGTSPITNELLKNLFKNINFCEEKRKIGSVRISEIEDIHNKIVESINYSLREIEE